MMEETRPRLLVNWQDERVRTRGRESLLVAGVLHLALVIMVAISPSLFGGTSLVAVEADSLQPDVTVLYLPSDAIEVPEAQPQPDLTPEERQRAMVRPLYLDPKDLAEVLPPRTQVVPLTPPDVSEDGGGPSFSPPEVAGSSSPPAPEEQAPERGREIAQLQDLPGPGARSGGSLELPQATTPGRAIQESLRQGKDAAGSGGGTPDGGGTSEPNLNTPFPTILSDTRGVDFSPYLVRLLREVRRNWYAVIPVSVRWGEQGRVVIVFTILQDGSVPAGQPTIVASSGRSHLDRPALAAIRASQPFPPLPAEFDGPHIVLQFTFLYNLPTDYTGP